MAQLVERGVPVVPLRVLSRLPSNLSVKSDSTTKCPLPLAGDDTAFAIYIPDEYVGFHKDALAFVSQRRDPVVNDIVLFELKDGDFKFHCILEIKDDRYITMKPLKFPLARAKIEKETIKFVDIAQMGVVVMIVRV